MRAPRAPWDEAQALLASVSARFYLFEHLETSQDPPREGMIPIFTVAKLRQFDK